MTEHTLQQDMRPHLQLIQIAAGHMRAQSVYVAAKLGIADILSEGPKDVEEIARRAGAHPQALYRLLRALASIGVFAEDESGRFALTPIAAKLRSDDPMTMRPMFLLGGSNFHWGSWSNLLHSVVTGESAFEHIHGEPLFEYLTKNLEDAEVYNAWMTRVTQMETSAIIQSYDFSGFQTIVDVGGGEGGLLTAILRINPNTKGVLFDLPKVAADAKAIDNADLDGRCEIVGGDFFEAVPAGGDLYILKTIIHDWSDELAVRILRNCRAAMTSNSRLLIAEMVLGEGDMSDFGMFMDLNMLVLTSGGMERTESEYRSLLSNAGFELSRSIRTNSPKTLLECLPV